eukprot:m.351952 g.351952  ORF g.351952 m.351952 type:complete len:393 (+) comp16410_c0_seq1:100-1278(+)
MVKTRMLSAMVALMVLGACVPSHAKCNMAATSKYPPDPSTALKWYDVDLDQPAADRWTHIVKPLSKQINEMIFQVVDLVPEALRKELLEQIDKRGDAILDAFPKEYGAEIKGIANATGVDLAALILYNMGYEVEGGCTSMVVRDGNNNLYHARNLDFGLFFGWDKANETWRLTELLRPLLFNARIMQGGKNIYNGTYYAGYVGLLTGMKQGGFSVSVDTRFDNTFWAGLVEWFKGENQDAHFVGFTTRETMENNATYAEALQTFTTAKMVGPSYMILGGFNKNEGAIVTRSANESLHLWTLENDLHNTGFYVIETNYDNWVKPPFFDNRREPAEDCLNSIGSAGIGYPALFDVLSAQPNLNLLTTYTTIMQVSTGRFEAYTQRCDTHPCTPW